MSTTRRTTTSLAVAAVLGLASACATPTTTDAPAGATEQEEAEDHDHGHVFSLATGGSRLALPPCLSPRAISSDGSRLVVDGRLLCTEVEGSFKVLDPPPGAVLRSGVLDARTGETLYDLEHRVVSWADLGPVGTPAERYAALLVGFRRIEIHDLDAGRLVGAFERPPEVFLTVWFSDDGRYLAFGAQSGRVTMLDVAAAAPDVPLEDTIVWSLEEPAGGAVTGTVIDGDRLATISMSGHLRVYDLADRLLLVDIEVAVESPPAVTFSPDGSALIYTDGPSLRWLELDLDRLVALARSRLTRAFTDEECTQYEIEHRDCAPAGVGP
jgi:WD40 repeat protein